MATTLLPPVSTKFICVVEMSFVPAADDNDELVISNIGALKMGLQALLREDAEDDDRAAQKWSAGIAELVQENEKNVGASATATIQFDDSFEMERIPVGL